MLLWVADESITLANPRDKLLHWVMSLGPWVVVQVEQDMNGNMVPFMMQFAEACEYYGA
ncbi:putative Scarecrow-like protein 1 [Cocos nucifera]|uniref:Putative Scarecrow-like protein 1 n=1 Tax=Cocos nucifera TaxID=13894 RepID=A0A8K0IVY1_COCNU|nr:putative Scarecrow-like protein 1 [Cocos nucifera]